jgi:hypothetical protein
MSVIAAQLHQVIPIHVPGAGIFTFTLVVLFPVADYLLYSRLQSATQIYIWNIVALWSLTIGGLRLIRKSGLTAADFGLRLGTYPCTLIVSVLLVLLVAALILLTNSRRKKQLQSSLRNP